MRLRHFSFLIIVFFFIAASGLKAQNNQVSGAVVDASSGETLPGVNISVKGTTSGTSTDSDGNYSLQVPSLEDSLRFSFIGYETKTVAINGQTMIDIELQPTVYSGEEMVVVGYGQQERSEISGSVSDIRGEEIARKAVTDSRRALQGVSSGLSIVDRGGAPGSGNVEFQIRGNTTIGGTNPLILVNGIEQDFSDINPDNIESISVLKDASATAIYGSRAANGVILVTTKTPQAQDLQVSYNGSYGFERPTNMPEHLGVEEYLWLQKDAFENRGDTSPYPDTEQEINEYVQNVRQGNTLEYPLPNPFFDVLLGPGPMQDHRLSISGGTENFSSRLSLQLTGQDGIIPNFGSARKEVRLDNSFDMADWIDLTTRVTYRRKNTHQPENGTDSIFMIWHGSQWSVPQFPDGRYGLNNRARNPLLRAQFEGRQNSITNYFVGNVKADVDLMENLSYTLQFGGFSSLQSNDTFQRKFQVRDYFTDQVRLTDPINSLNENRSVNQQWTLKNLINYQIALDEKNDLEFLGGFEQTWSDFEAISAFRQDFYTNNLRVLGAGSRDNLDNIGSRTEERLRSVFGRINYSYDDRYIVEANARYDGSSKFFGAENQYSFFPSFSAAWNMSNEQFWEPLSSIVTNLKLRASWGQTGNNTVNLYTFFQGINIGSNYTFGDQIVRTSNATGLVNPNLTWETTTQTNVGFDAEFWEGKLSVSFDYWDKKTEDILLNLPIPETVGLQGPPQNAGRVDNTGWELSVTHQNYVSDDFDYSITANLSDFRNEVVDLARSGPFIETPGGAAPFITREGAPLNSMWGYVDIGLFQSEEEIQNNPTFASKDNTYPGDQKYSDLNGDGQITPDDKTIIGNTDPHYTFGLNSSFNYQNWDLNVFIQGVGQMDRMPVGAAIECGNWLGYTLDLCSDYWTPENRDAFVPRPQKNSRKNNTVPDVVSTRVVVNAAYVRLKDVQLGYTLPSTVTSKVGISKLRFYLSGTNIFWISDAKKWGLDPEFNSTRLGYYPQTSQYVVGVNLNF